MLPDAQPMPGMARMLNTIGARFHQTLAPLIRLDADEMMAIVSRRLGLTDYGDPFFIEGLRRLVDSLNNEADLTFLGRILQRSAHGLELRPAAEARMAEFIRCNPQHKHGKHRYRAEDFGTTDGRIKERFTEYMELFGFAS